MKTKKLLAMLLLVLMMFAAVGTMAGCGGKDGGDDKKVETQDKDDDKKEKKDKKDKKEEPQATATPEPTATPTPEVFPTVEELFDANKDMFEENMKMTTKFAYKTPTEYGEMAMDIDMALLCYDDISYEYGEVTISMMDFTETMKNETYYVDDKASAMRTEYSFDNENSVWVKSQYEYIAADELQDFPYETMKDAEVSQEGEFYYVTGVVEDVENLGDVDSFGVDGLEMDSVSCSFKFDKKTKNVVSVEFVYKFDMEGVDGTSVFEDDLLVVIETYEEPIVIPEEVLAAEFDTEVDIDGEVITGDGEDDVAVSELPENWGGSFDSYKDKSGSFLMWSDELGDNIPITLYENDNWYFDNQYTYTLYAVVDDPAVCDYAPAHQVDYGDSGVSTEDPEAAMPMILERDFTESKTVEDIVPFVCGGKQCFYLDISIYDSVSTYVVLQDIGLESYVDISIISYDTESDPLTLIQKFLISIE